MIDILSKFEPDHRAVAEIQNAINSSERLLVLGAGRSLNVGADFVRSCVAAGIDAYVENDASFPQEYKETDLVLGITGSGGTESVVKEMKTAAEYGAGIGVITSKPESEAGNIVRDYSGLLMHIPAKDKNGEGNDGEFSFILGGEFELKCLMSTSATAGSLNGKIEFPEYYSLLKSGIDNYSPELKEIDTMYNLLPEPHPQRKIKIIADKSELGEFIATRMRHCAKTDEGQERRAELHDGNPPTKRGDLIIGFGAYGDTANLVNLEKVRGAKLLVVTGSDKTPLAKTNPNYAAIVPGIPADSFDDTGVLLYRDRIGEDIFKLNSLLMFECLTYRIMDIEGLSEKKHLKPNHSLTS